ncbi:MAG: alpha-glucosidase [Cyanobacteria bacterium P01_C01_bin.89]
MTSKFGQGAPWWHGCVIYEIYIRSFYDSNGDGIGDLQGIIEQLDYVESLGVDAIWVTPFFPSPMKDFGYDVSDYCGVDSRFGTMDDFEQLIEAAHKRDLKVIIDQVWSHTSDIHPWFRESRSSYDNAKADWYIWADSNEGRPPNNWLSIFGGSAWTWCNQRQQYYLHNFLECQPDLNWHNPEVVNAISKVAEFWLDKGIDGFRLDACNYYMHNRRMADNPRRTKGMAIQDGVSALNPYSKYININNMSQVDNLHSIKRIREVLDKYPGRIAMGEIVAADDPGEMAAEYVRGCRRLHTAYNSSLLVERPLTAQLVVDALEDLGLHLEGEPICWTACTHDFPRTRTRWGPKDSEQSDAFCRLLSALLVSLPGMVSLYQGEELGLPETKIPKKEMQDPFGIHFAKYFAGRDGCRTPMPWKKEEDHYGFTEAESPWLITDPNFKKLTIDQQDADPNSMLNFFREFVKWRQQQPALRSGSLEVLESDRRLLLFTRESYDEYMLCAFNLSGALISWDIPEGMTIHKIHHEQDIVMGNNEKVIFRPYSFVFCEITNEDHSRPTLRSSASPICPIM